VDFALMDERLLELRAQVRRIIAETVTPEAIEEAHESGTNLCWPLHRRLGAEGVLARVVPGIGTGDPLELFVLNSELEKASAPYDASSMVVAVASVVARLGTEAQQQAILPGLLSGESLICMGLTEPDGGSDLPAVRTRAVRDPDGGGWIVNGAKMWTTMAHVADWILLLTRDDPGAGRYQGYTMFMMPMSLPGITVEPVWTMSTERSNATFYDDVHVGDEWVLGEAGGGWRTLGVMLAFERGLANTQAAVPLLRRFAAWATETGAIDDPLVRDAMAQVAIENEVAKLLTQRTVWKAARGDLPGTEGSIAKVFASESYQRAARRFQAAAGPEGLLGLREPRAAAGGWIDHDVRHSVPQTLQGGTSEINRNNIAERHLGLPRSR
jgi:alkylation response protein AidB-like acyl-CoA dehydrogenase